MHREKEGRFGKEKQKKNAMVDITTKDRDHSSANKTMIVPIRADNFESELQNLTCHVSSPPGQGSR